MDGDIRTPASKDFETTLAASETQYTKPSGTACSIQEIESLAKDMLDTLPRIDRDKIRIEMGAMHVPVFSDPTTFDINNALSLVQGYKDRLAGIISLASREYNLRKRIVDMLLDSNNVISKASSQDKRKGEAIMKYPIAVLNMEAAETFVEEVELSMTNMKSIGEVISRQASVISAQIALGEYRKRQPGMPVGANGQAEEIDYKSGTKKLGTNLNWDNI